ncbi:MAG: histidine kinase [Lautropia sp.]|nr:MAG: histidine kinase [Pseudomonadota bacterium]MBC6958680.1 histidine kinase [Lautropia sp.]MCL4703357.1 GAF domain-containing protein [Burkholderiaceae bacterium]MCZ2413863.1 GAF domain-containing protein [Burkholderiales bacterium]MDL1907126.1 histidine kinase [Betaproteobacteria bacterium PRO1]
MAFSDSGRVPGRSPDAATLVDAPPSARAGKVVRVVPIADNRIRRPDARGATAPAVSGVGGTPQSMLDAFLVTVVRLAGARAGAVRALTPEGDKLRLVAAWGLPDEVLAREALIGPCGVCGDALQGDTVRVADSASPCGTLAVDSFFEQVCTGTVAVPLEYKGRSVGVFTLFFDGVHSLRGEVIHLLRPVGQLFGLALENARLERENLQSSLVQERQTIAGELHDSLAQSLTFVRMRMPLLQDAIAQQDTARAQKYCEDVNEELGSANRRMRELITHFRAGMDAQGLHRALEQIADTFYERTGVALEFDCRIPELRLPAEVEVQAFHILQEALANVRRHSGARRAWLRIERDGPDVVFSVRDDGRGFMQPAACGKRAARPGFGLEIMRERAQAIGARVAFESPPSGGARVVVRIPAGEPVTAEARHG